MRNTIIFMLLFFLSSICAQEKHVDRNVKKIGGFRNATLELKSGEVLKGKIRDQLYVGGYWIFKDEKGKKQKISKFEVNKATIDYTTPSKKNSGKLIYLRIYPDGYESNNYFAQVLIDGKIKLLRFVTDGGTTIDANGMVKNIGHFQHILMNEQGTLFDLESSNSIIDSRKTLIESLKKFLPCEELIKKVENKELKKNKLEEIVYFYNTKCI